MIRGRIRLVDPADRRRVTGTYGWSESAADDAVERARRAFASWSGLTLARRIEILRRFRRVLAGRAGDLAEQITRDTGKAITEAREEAALLLSKIDITIEHGAREIARIDAGPSAYGLFRPYGVAAVLGPFNFPLHLAHGHIIPALAAGNTVVFKPSDKACGAGALYARCVRAANLPPGVFNLVQGPGSIGARLAAHPDVPLVMFTGSYRVGRDLKRRTLNQPDKVLALEMGGKNAAIICADADLAGAAAECARSAYATAGQRCTSTSRIFAHPRVIDEFCKKFSAAVRALRVGDPRDPGVFCGPLITEEAVRRAEIALREARRLGGEPILAGGRIVPFHGNFVALSAHRFSTYPGAHRYTTEELFVPETGIYPARDPDEAIELAESVDYSLALSVFTRRRSNFDRVLARSTHGVVNWNIGTIGASGRLPFGGRKRSGNARPAGLYAIRNCVYPAAVRVK